MNNFTPRAQQVLALSRKEADRFHHNYVGTEHLLLGLINLGQGVAVNVLQKMGLDLEKQRRHCIGGIQGIRFYQGLDGEQMAVRGCVKGQRRGISHPLSKDRQRPDPLFYPDRSGAESIHLNK